MLTALLALVLTADVGCPSCPRAAASTCHALCRCAFPGHCGHTGCTCKIVSGLAHPPVDRWVPFAVNPAYEVYGHEVDGVFRYTQRRPKAARAVPGTGATFVTCHVCGQSQFLIYQHQQCSRCGMFLPRPAAASTSSPCAGGRCGR